MMVVISHERDLLNNVVDHILHLEGGKVTLYPAAMTAFERQRAERAAQLAAAKASRMRSAPSCRTMSPATARAPHRQAGAIARQGAGQDAADRGADRGSVAEFRFSRARRTAPPLITLDMAAVGYERRKCRCWSG
jgi:ATP-binding cassette subfamily F protein 3